MKYLLILLALFGANIPYVHADVVQPIVCEPSVSILYNDFDEVVASVFIPQDCPILGEPIFNPVEVLEEMTITLQRKSVPSGGSFSSAPLSLVSIAMVDVTTITTVYDDTYLVKVVLFPIVPSYTTTDYHRFVVEVGGSQGKAEFAMRAATSWVATPPPPAFVPDAVIIGGN